MSNKAPAAVKVTKEEEKDPRKITRRVKVYRLNVDETNKDLLISVNDLGDVRNGKKEFLPGQEVDLTQVQVNILQSAVVVQQIALDAYSGVHGEANPLRAAEAQYPGFTATYCKHTGNILAKKHTPNYSVEDVR